MAIKKQIKSLVRRAGFTVHRTKGVPRQLLDPKHTLTLDFHHAVCRYLVEVGSSIKFLQIGAFDGQTCDPLLRYIEKFRWTGVLIEPQPSACKKLELLYESNPRIKVLNVAVDRTSGKRTLYTVNGTGLPEWAESLASFSRDSILKHSKWLPQLEERIQEQDVTTMTFDRVMAHFETPDIDLLQLDTEGADAILLSFFPFETVRPRIIQWESKHLTLDEAEANLERLAKYGYRFATSGHDDTIAILSENS